MNNKTKAELIGFELGVRDSFATGDLPFLVHLCGGNEDQLIALFEEARPGDWFFSTHRNHYHYLLAGGSEARLMSLIKDGRSMFVFDRKLNFLSSAVLGGLCGVAAGTAWQIARDYPDFRSTFGFPAHRGWSTRQNPPHVWCFVGDGAEENGHLYEAVMFVMGHGLPCTFVIEDNDRSVEVSKVDRTGHFRMAWPECVRIYHYNPTYPHAGPGLKEMITFKPEVVATHTPR